nr:hypothetical protein [Tanacetum cinerariifolium]
VWLTVSEFFATVCEKKVMFTVFCQKGQYGAVWLTVSEFFATVCEKKVMFTVFCQKGQYGDSISIHNSNKMSNTNTNLKTHTSNALHNAIMEASGIDRPPMLSPGSSETTTEGYMENYKNVSQDIRNQLDAKAKAVHIILTGIDTDSKAIVNSPPPTYYQEPTMVAEDDEMSMEKEINKLMDLISLYDNQRAVTVVKAKENIEEQGDTNITTNSLDMSTNRETVDQDDDDLARERNLLASLIDKLKYEINNSKNHNKLLESSNKTLVDKLKGEIEDFKTKNKSLELSNNHFKEANNELSKTNQLMFKDLKKFQAELDRYHDVNYESNVEIDCAKAKGDLLSYKTKSQKSFNEYI